MYFLGVLKGSLKVWGARMIILAGAESSLASPLLIVALAYAYDVC